MLQMPVSEIVSKICKDSKISEDEVKDRIKNKVEEHKGLVSEEGAAHIVANDLGVKLFEQQMSGKPIEVKDVLIGMKKVDVIGKVIRLFGPRKFVRDGQENKVGNFILADETGSIRIVLWNSKLIDWMQDGTLKPGMIIHIKNGYVRDNKFSGKEIHLGLRGQLILDVDAKIDVDIPKIDGPTQVDAQEESISNASPGSKYKLRGTVVRIFNPNFYRICGDCGKKAKQEGEKFSCGEHGDISPKTAMVVNFVLDDGTANLRCAAFRQIAENIIGKTAQELQESANSAGGEALETTVNEALLGEEIEVEGTIRENKAFDRVELMVDKAEKVSSSAIVNRLLNKGVKQNSKKEES